jgi:hypothetical protein
MAALNKAPVFVPPRVDEAILAHARRHLASRQPERTPRLTWAWWAAAAAAVAFGAWISQPLLSRRSARPPTVVREDINGDGRVDILDAFALARGLDQATVRQPDLNDDGRVDRRDVDWLAGRVVQLDKGS